MIEKKSEKAQGKFGYEYFAQWVVEDFKKSLQSLKKIEHGKVELCLGCHHNKKCDWEVEFPDTFSPSSAKENICDDCARDMQDFIKGKMTLRDWQEKKLKAHLDYVKRDQDLRKSCKEKNLPADVYIKLKKYL